MARHSSGSDQAEALAVRLAAVLEEAGAAASVSAASRRRLFGSLVRIYAASPEEAVPPLDVPAVSAEAVVMTAAAMLKAAEVTSFELAALFDV